MKKYGFSELRKDFLDYFEARDHIRLKSFSLVPDHDPSLLLINAGMAPLKPYFMGEKKMAKDRVVTSQRCMRTADLENVGKTARHATFFEMLGNFSFGDYFKKEAIRWSWDFVTNVIGLPAEDMWITVFQDDDEAYELWTKDIGIRKERMLHMGKADNFWELDQGPCGPCSEIHIDRGEKWGEGTSPLDNDDRFMELWNLVFTQFDRQPDGTTYIPLKKPNIDTGMGLERLAMVCEDKGSIFDIDEFEPLRQEISQLLGKKYGEDPKADESFRILIDHSKASAFMALDGIVPSNVGRGYVLRRIIRRAYLHGYLMGNKEEILTRTIDKIIPVYQDEYPELVSAQKRINTIIHREEESFQETIDTGLDMLDDRLSDLKKRGEKVLSGKDAFKLYDTYGFPLDLTVEMAAKREMKVDEEDFRQRMEERRDLSRRTRKGGVGWDAKKDLDIKDQPASIFTGYDHKKDEGKVLCIIVDGERVSDLKAGQKGLVLFDQTPFYAESGGQLADQGQVFKEDALEAVVTDVQKDADDHFLHTVEVKKGCLEAGEKVHLEVSSDRREDIRRNHSATHLLDAALIRVLGPHVKQAGSEVDQNRLRFDFTHYQPMTEEEIREVEEAVNRAIFDALPAKTEILDKKEAEQKGAIGLFEEKYKDQVRVVSFGDFSKELCGGTHVENTAQIGLFHILSEQGVSSGVRRIEAVTGRALFRHYMELEDQLGRIGALLKGSREQVEEKVDQLLEENKNLKKEIASFESKAADSLSKKLAQNQETIGGAEVICEKLPGKSMDELKEIADALKEGKNRCWIVLASEKEGKVFWVVSLSEALVKEGGHAGNMIRDLARTTGGNGGGRATFATAGGKDPSKIEAALALVPEIIRGQLKKQE